MFAQMKHRHRGSNLLPETKGEWCGYAVGLALFPFMTFMACMVPFASGAPRVFMMHPVFWVLIGIASLFSGGKIMVMTHRHQAKRTKESEVAVTGAST